MRGYKGGTEIDSVSVSLLRDHGQGDLPRIIQICEMTGSGGLTVYLPLAGASELHKLRMLARCCASGFFVRFVMSPSRVDIS